MEQTKRGKVVVTGSFITDIAVFTSRFPADGETVPGRSIQFGPGGKGSNQATAASRAGAEVIMITKIGTDFMGEIARTHYKNENMTQKYVYTQEGGETGSAIIEINAETAENRIIVLKGANDALTKEEIDQAETDIERLCLRLLLQQQPVARDLRQISAALKMITDMERIGDQASDIAEIIITEDKSEAQDIPMIIKMSEAASKMVRDSVNAYVEKDLDLARKVMENDDVVDELFEEVKTTLINFIAENKGLQGVEAIDLIMVAKYLERIADHATNIAEWVEFSITGIHKSSVV